MIEYKSSNFVTTSAGAASDGWRISGYLTKWGEVDGYDDITIKGAFAQTIRENPTLPLLFGHDVKQPPIGIVKAWREDNTGVHFVAEIAQTTAGRDVKTLIDQGSLSGVSYGYNVKKFDFAKQNGGRVRRLLEVDVLETSIVTWPALPSARLTSAGEKDRLTMATFETLESCGQPIDKALKAAYTIAKRRAMLREIDRLSKLTEIEASLAEMVER